MAGARRFRFWYALVDCHHFRNREGVCIGIDDRSEMSRKNVTSSVGIPLCPFGITNRRDDSHAGYSRHGFVVRCVDV